MLAHCLVLHAIPPRIRGSQIGLIEAIINQNAFEKQRRFGGKLLLLYCIFKLI